MLDKLSFVFEELGAQQVKYIARPVEAYRVNLAGDAEPVCRHERSLRRLVDRALRRPRPIAALAAIAILIAGPRSLDVAGSLERVRRLASSHVGRGSADHVTEWR